MSNSKDTLNFLILKTIKQIKMKQKLNLIAVLIALIFFSSCKDFNKKKHEDNGVITKSTEHYQQTDKKDCKDVHWSHHKGDEGPTNWKNLCDDYADCGGMSQSPIDIISQTAIKTDSLNKLKFNYGTSNVAILNNSHTVQFNVDGKNSVNLNGKDYELLQFHYHALSEHTIDGKHFPLEVHFVHKHADSDFAVIGVMFEEGKENELINKYLDKFPTKKGNYKTDEKIDLLKLFPEDLSYYHYSGSLTTPPCSEVVSWYVLKNPVQASKEQIEEFSKILNNNFRPTQPLNDRPVSYMSTK